MAPALLFADDFRCPNSGKIIESGMNQYEVQIKCGDPAAKSTLSSVNQIINGTVVAVATAEEWTYDFGPNQFIRKIKFENGMVSSIQAGDYGVKLPTFAKAAKQ